MSNKKEITDWLEWKEWLFVPQEDNNIQMSNKKWMQREVGREDKKV